MTRRIRTSKPPLPVETLAEPEVIPADPAGEPDAFEDNRAPVALPPYLKVWVHFVFTRHDGSRDQSRVFITGLPDIRTEGLLKGVEDQIKQSTPDYASVMITNWKALEG